MPMWFSSVTYSFLLFKVRQATANVPISALNDIQQPAFSVHIDDNDQVMRFVEFLRFFAEFFKQNLSFDYMN